MRSISVLARDLASTMPSCSPGLVGGESQISRLGARLSPHLRPRERGSLCCSRRAWSGEQRAASASFALVPTPQAIELREPCLFWRHRDTRSRLVAPWARSTGDLDVGKGGLGASQECSEETRPMTHCIDWGGSAGEVQDATGAASLLRIEDNHRPDSFVSVPVASCLHRSCCTFLGRLYL